LASCVPLAISVAAGKLWQLTICTLSASCVAVGKPWRLAIWTLLASCVTVNELHTVGKPCGSGAICVAVSKLYTAGELYIAGELCGSRELCGSGQAVWQRASLGVFGGHVGADVSGPPHTLLRAKAELRVIADPSRSLKRNPAPINAAGVEGCCLRSYFGKIDVL